MARLIAWFRRHSSPATSIIATLKKPTITGGARLCCAHQQLSYSNRLPHSQRLIPETDCIPGPSIAGSTRLCAHNSRRQHRKQNRHQNHCGGGEPPCAQIAGSRRGSARPKQGPDREHRVGQTRRRKHLSHLVVAESLVYYSLTSALSRLLCLLMNRHSRKLRCSRSGRVGHAPRAAVVPPLSTPSEPALPLV